MQLQQILVHGRGHDKFCLQNILYKILRPLNHRLCVAEEMLLRAFYLFNVTFSTVYVFVCLCVCVCLLSNDRMTL